MSLFVDVGELYAIAARISTHADHTRVRAVRLQRHVEHLQWRGPAADAFVPLAIEVERSLRTSATHLDDAAASLRSHARTVENVTQRLQQLAVDIGTDVIETAHTGLVITEVALDGAGGVLSKGGGILGGLLGIGS